MRRIAHSIKASLLVFLLAMTLASGAPAQQAASRPTIQNYPSLQLPYQERARLWGQLLNGEDHLQGLALGESLLSGTTTRPDKVWVQSMLAWGYLEINDIERADELLAESRSIVESVLFRGITNGGDAGYWKYRALTTYHGVLCVKGIYLYKPQSVDSDCRATVEYSERARALVKYSSHDQRMADAVHIRVLTHKARAEILGGNRSEARRTLETALGLISQGLGTNVGTAFTYRTASRLALDMGDLRGAEVLARRSVEIWDGRGSSPTNMRMLLGRQSLQDVLVMAGRWGEANLEFDSIDAAVAGVAQAERRTENLLPRSLAYAYAGRLQKVLPLLRAATNEFQSRFGVNHYQAALREGLLGAARTQSDDPAERQQAMPTLKHAVQVLLTDQDRSDHGEGRTIDQAVARFIMERYLELTAVASTDPGSEEGALAFQVAETLRSSSVQGAIQDAAARASIGSGALGELVRREQDLGNEARALRDFIVRQTAETVERRVDAIVEQMRKRLDVIAGQRAELRADIAKGFPQYAELVRPQAPTPQLIARHLGEGEVFVSLLPTEAGIHAWAVSRGSSHYHFSPGATQRVALLLAVLRQSTEIESGTGRPARFAAQASHKLYQELFGPLQPQLAQARHLIVAGGGEFGRLPYAALLQKPWEGDDPVQAEWLIKRMATSQIPSASAWLSVQRLTAAARAQETLAAWGDPRFNIKDADRTSASATRGTSTVRAVAWTRASKGFELTPGRTSEEFGYARIPALPETRDELQAIARALGADDGKDLRLGAQATRASVIAASKSGELGRKRVVAFATHGLMAGDLPNLNQPALAMAATGNEDKEPLAPLLTLEDVLTLKLNADWVVLSACNTAAGDGMGDEALSGLARGFLYAGSRSLLVTQWAVETESAKLLTTGAFEHYIANPQASKAESLRQSMLKVMQRPEYGHPAYWAPFVLIGDGAR